MTVRRQLTLVVLLAAACFLPGEPSGAGRVTFELDFAQPFRVPLAGAAQPAVKISADGRVLSGPNYHLESLDPGVVQVDPTGRGLAGVARGTASVRVVYETATTGAPDTTFAVRVVVSRVAVNSGTLAFTRLADTSRLTATAYDAQDAPVPSVKFAWSSAEPHVASVDSAGLVRALNEGTVAITAEADSVTGSSSVSVTQVAAAVRMVPKLDTLRTVSRSTQFLAVALDDTNGFIRTAKPRWTSSDEKVAKIDSLGLATATGAGTAKIIARVGAATDTAIMVVAQVVRFIAMSPSFDTLRAIADTVRHKALAFDSLDFPIPKPSVVWATGDTAVATVDPTGLVRATRNGVVLITASVAGHSAFVTVVVHQEVATARLSPANVALSGTGAAVQMSALGLDRNGYPVAGAAFAWRSGAACVAMVDAAGFVTAQSGGTTGITATLVNGVVSGTAAVTVAGPPAPIIGQIAFDSPRGVEIMSACGLDRRLLINNPAVPPGWDPMDAHVLGPTWSPDGDRLAYTWDPYGEGFWAVYVARADGSDARRLIGPDAYDGGAAGTVWFADPAWSPDGKKIAVRGETLEGNYRRIHVVNVDGTNMRVLPNPRASHPSWSPDGTKLAFQGNEGVYVVNADGTGAASLIGPAGGAVPAWSPDGSQLAFVHDSTIWVMNADGSGARSLGVVGGQPAWALNGTYIVFAGGPRSDLDAIKRDGSGLLQLTATDEPEQHPSWRP
jgi:uncharacterized protein YjdB